jgi:3-phenylpropionate/trans-cinnamate dioxygenase ferredoxin component
VAEFVTVGKPEDVPDGEPKAFDVGERVIAVVKLEDGYFAFDDECTHRQCSLAEGELEERSIICPCHGSEFDARTGEVLSPPAVQPLQMFEVRVEDGQLQIAV